MKILWRGRRATNGRAFEQVLDRFDDRLNPIDSVHAVVLADERVRFHFRTSLSGHGYVNRGVLAEAEARLAHPFAFTTKDPDALLDALRRHYTKAVYDQLEAAPVE